LNNIFISDRTLFDDVDSLHVERIRVNDPWWVVLIKGRDAE
jgi:hypothetical protein